MLMKKLDGAPVTFAPVNSPHDNHGLKPCISCVTKFRPVCVCVEMLTFLRSLTFKPVSKGLMPTKIFVPVFDGDGLADLLVWRASSRTWYWLTSSPGYSYASAALAPWS
jgi:hypothetical protein